MEVGGFPDNDYRYIAEDGTIKANSRGRLQTGDIGFLDADGHLHVTGREKELIIRGGINISPLEIDSILMQRPEIIEVATVGVPDRTYGEEVISFVVARPGAKIDIDDLLRYCSTCLPASKAPKQIVQSTRCLRPRVASLTVELWRRIGQAVIASDPYRPSLCIAGRVGREIIGFTGR